MLLFLKSIFWQLTSCKATSTTTMFWPLMDYFIHLFFKGPGHWNLWILCLCVVFACKNCPLIFLNDSCKKNYIYILLKLKNWDWLAGLTLSLVLSGRLMLLHWTISSNLRLSYGFCLHGLVSMVLTTQYFQTWFHLLSSLFKIVF